MQNAERQPKTHTRPKVRIITSDASGTYAATVLPEDEVILLYTALGVMTLTLPPVSEMGGKLLAIRQAGSGTNATTVAAHSADAAGWSNLTINAVNEGVVLYSDGLSWWTMASTIA